MQFNDTSTAGSAAITVQNGGRINFSGTSDGGTSAIVNNVGGTFDISQHTGGVTVGSISGAGDFFLGGNSLTTGSLNTDTEVSGIIRDGGLAGGSGGSLVKIGTGKLTLSGSNIYTGGTTLANGSLFVNNNSALGTGTLTITASGGPVTLSSGVAGTTINNAVSVQGDFSVGTNTDVQPGNQNFTFNGPVNLNGATRTITGVTLQGQVHFGGTISNGGLTLNTTFTNQGDYVAFITNASNVNTYTGLTTVNNGAFLVLQGSTKNGAVQGDVLIQGDGVVDYLGSSSPFASEQIADNATVTVNSTGNNLSGTQFAGFDLFNAQGKETIGTLNGNGTVFVASSTLAVGAGNFSGAISDGSHSGMAGGGITKYGPGTLTLSGANSYTGATTVNGGTLSSTRRRMRLSLVIPPCWLSAAALSNSWARREPIARK